MNIYPEGNRLYILFLAAFALLGLPSDQFNLRDSVSAESIPNNGSPLRELFRENTTLSVEMTDEE